MRFSSVNQHCKATLLRLTPAPNVSVHGTAMIVAIYARVSTTDQNCETQLHELRQYVAQRGWEVFQEYVDTGFSGRLPAGRGSTRPYATPGSASSKPCWSGSWTVGAAAWRIASARSRSWFPSEFGSSAQRRASTPERRALCPSFCCTCSRLSRSWSAALSANASGLVFVRQRPRERACGAHSAHLGALRRNGYASRG